MIAGACGSGYRCVGTCEARTALGASCFGSEECIEGAYCSPATNPCEAKSDARGPCFPDGSVCSGSACKYTSLACVHGLLCEPPAGGTGACFGGADCTGGSSFCCDDGSGKGVCSSTFGCTPPKGACTAP